MLQVTSPCLTNQHCPHISTVKDCGSAEPLSTEPSWSWCNVMRLQLPSCCCVYTGDNDAILVLLLIPRLMAKCELLMTQVRDKVCNIDSVSCFAVTVIGQFEFSNSLLPHHTSVVAATRLVWLTLHQLGDFHHHFLKCRQQCGLCLRLFVAASAADNNVSQILQVSGKERPHPCSTQILGIFLLD